MIKSEPWLIETHQLENILQIPELVLIDISQATTYNQGHIPGAHHLDYTDIIRNELPRVGLLPHESKFAEIISHIGINSESYIVAYDDEGGGKAARFLWNLEVTNHKNKSLLNGGILAWRGENRTLTTSTPKIVSSECKITYSNPNCLANADYILKHLNNPNVKILDTRTAQEFNGTDKRAARNGHIPGAINYDWLEIKDSNNFLRLKPLNELQNKLNALNLTSDNEIITMCHSHHRSALTYVLLKALGYDKVKGYPGSWSDWANTPNTPIEN